MKKVLLMLSMVLATWRVDAKELQLVVKGAPLPKGKTSVTSTSGNISDTLIVVPGNDITSIQVLVKDESNNTLGTETIPAVNGLDISCSIPALPNSAIIEIRDNKGVVYREYNF